MKKAKAGDWVRVHGVVLSASDRAPKLPSDTKAVPLEIWLKGYLTSDAQIGDEVEITTSTGRRVSGHLVEVNPQFDLDYGTFRPELLKIGKQVRSLLLEEQ